MKRTLLSLVAAAIVFGSISLGVGQRAEAAWRFGGGLSRAFWAVDRSRSLKSSSTKKDPRNSIAHQMLWGPPSPGWGR